MNRRLLAGLAAVLATCWALGPAATPSSASMTSPHANVPASDPCPGLLTVVLAGVVSCTHGPDPEPERRAVAANGSAGSAAAAFTFGGAVPCAGDGTSGPRVQALYAHPSDGPDNFNQFAASIRGWAADVDRNIADSAAQTGGVRHPVWVTTSPCQLDVGDVSIPPGAAAASDPNVWAPAFANAGFNRSDRKYLIWMDTSTAGLCGVSTLYPDERPSPSDNNNNGKFPQYGRIDRTCWGGMQQGLDRSIETHELTHMLGAVGANAPHHNTTAHCFDGDDVMCQKQASADPPVQAVCPAINQSLLDCDHDDYFTIAAPPAGSYLAANWNTANSNFLTATPSPPGPAPSIAAVSPANGATGSSVSVTINGANFHAAVFVQLERPGQNPVEMPDAVASGGNQITGSFNLALTATGSWALRVINQDDASVGTAADVFTVLGPPPTVSAVSPGTVVQHGSATETVTGTNFTNGDMVSVDGGAAVGSVDVPDATHLTVSLTGLVPGHHDLTVTDGSGRSARCGRCLVVIGTDPVAFGFSAFPGFGGGATVAGGHLVPNVPGDEVVVGPGPGGGPNVQVFSIDPSSGAATMLASFFAYDAAFAGGVRVAVGELDGNPADGKELVTAPGPGGGPDVRIWKIGADGTVSLHTSFLAYGATFAGGVNVAAGDVDPNAAGDEIVTGPGPGGGPHVRVFDVSAGGAVGSPGFFAYDPRFGGGVSVAVGHFGSAGPAIVTGPGPGGGPDVEAFTPGGGRFGGFLAYDAGFLGGVSVAAGDVDGRGSDKVITGAGPGGGPDVRIWDAGALVGEYFPFGNAPVGVRVALADTDDDGHAEIITCPWVGGPVLIGGHRL